MGKRKRREQLYLERYALVESIAVMGTTLIAALMSLIVMTYGGK